MYRVCIVITSGIMAANAGSYSNFVRDCRGIIPIKGDECNKDYKVIKVIKVIKDYKDSRT